jgi:DNA end-binding protein Ku
MAPRSIWTGLISFGLVNVPVKMYSAIDEQDIHFHYVHTKDDSPIGYEKVCKLEDKPVPDDEIVKAYETKNGDYVYMEDEDFEAAEEKGPRTIEVLDFVPYEDIDPIYFERTYYLGPGDNADKPYTLLLRAMETTELAGIVKYVMRNKQHLGCLRIIDDVITLEKMFFADEIRSADAAKPSRASVPANQVELAVSLIENFTSKWDPDKYEDTYRDRLLEVIKAKSKGKEVHPKQEPADDEPADLMAALRASIEQSQRGRRTQARPKSSNSLSELSKEELLDRASRAEISGRSKMSKQQLVRALERAA